MGERKVLNKYISADFDPAKIPRRRKPKNEQMKIRTMLSMSVRCNTCGNFMYKGTKINSRKEPVVGEKYLGLQIFRFYFKCTWCSAELTIKTDPQNSDYTVESGATRNFEPWRIKDELVAKEQQKRVAKEMGDAMKSLENRTLDSKREIDILAALDEVKSMKSRQANVDANGILQALQRSAEEKEKKLLEEDEALVKLLFSKQREIIRTFDDADVDDDNNHCETPSNSFKKRRLSANTPSNVKQGNVKFIFRSPSAAISVVEKLQPEEEKKQKGKVSSNFGNTSLQSLWQCYNSEEDDS